jgi:hypothetical protein
MTHILISDDRPKPKWPLVERTTEYEFQSQYLTQYEEFLESQKSVH